MSIASDTAVYLSGPGITLILAAGGNLSSYSASATGLILALEAGSTVTVKSNTLYTLTNSQSSSTRCSASPAYSYVTFSAASPTTVTVTPSATVACSGTAPVISAFSASPGAITSGQSSTLSWSLSGADTVSIDHTVGSQSNASSSSTSVSPAQTTTYTLTATNYVGTTTVQTTVTVTSTPPAVASFTASPSAITAGQSSTLSWTVSGNPAPTVSIDNSLGTQTGSSVLVSPTSDGQTCSNIPMLVPTEIVAWVGAVTGLTALVWDFYKWKVAGPKLTVSISVGMTLANAPTDTEYIVVRVGNVGTSPTTLNMIGFAIYDSWLARMRLKPRNGKAFVVLHPFRSSPLPFKLDVGAEWTGLIGQDAKLNAMIDTGRLWFEMHHLNARRPASTRIKKGN